MSPAAKGADAPVFELDLGGAPPAQGAVQDRIPPGTYELRLEKMERAVSQAKRTMARCSLRVNDGDYAGKRLSELFVFPQTEEDSQLGLQRFHAFLIALGMKEQTKVVRIDGTQFVGRTCMAEVDDEEQPPVYEDDGETIKYPARIRSRPLAFYRVDDPAVSANGAAPAAPDAAPEAETVETPTPAAVAAPAAPKAKATKATAAPAPEPADPVEPDAAGPDPDSVAAELENLFGEEEA